MSRRLRLISFAALLAAASACSSPESGPGPGSGGTTAVDDCDGRAEPISAGVAKDSSKGFHFELVELTPAVPIQTSTSPGNRWLVRVTDGMGQPVTGATLNVTTYMPDHDHSGPPAAGVESSDGNYVVDELFFPMPGLYAVTLSAATADGMRQNVELMMCLGVSSG